MLRGQSQQTKRTLLSRKSPGKMGFSAADEISARKRTLLLETFCEERGFSAAAAIPTTNGLFPRGTQVKRSANVSMLRRESQEKTGFPASLPWRQARGKTESPPEEISGKTGMRKMSLGKTDFSCLRGTRNNKKGV